MSARTLAHSALILFTLFLLAIVQRTELNTFLPQFLGGLVLLYFTVQFLLWRKWVASHHEGWIRDSEAVMFVVMGVILVELTGGLGGPLSFILYLLILYLGVLLEPGISFAVAIGLLVYFFPTTEFGSLVFSNSLEIRNWKLEILLNDLLRLLSLLLMVPFALFFDRRVKR
ncbi:MAG: hypothetical protein Q8R11_02975 [bacterium]|nr:hypothetical protein [bacterium]